MLALITGASSGIGRALAREFAKDGYSLVLIARREDELYQLARELKREHGRSCECIPLNLADHESARRLCWLLDERDLKVDVLVNNAGFGMGGVFHEQDYRRQLELMSVNMAAPVELTRLLLPGMKERNAGGILFVASIAAALPGPLMALYYASKSFVTHFAEALHYELRDTALHVSCLCPGPVKTGFADEAGMAQSTLFNRRMQRAERVATIAYRDWKRGHRLIFPDAASAWTYRLARFLPHCLSMPIVERLHR